MRKMGYTLSGLVVLTLLFTAGISLSDDWVPQQIEGYYAAGIGEVTYASDMLWSQVYTPDALYVATISDLEYDPGSGRVTTVFFNGIKNMGNQEVAVPFSKVARTGNAIYVYVAPEDVYRFYGEAPYWDEGFNRYSGETMPARSFRIGDSFGATVRSTAGEELGRVSDFAIDSMDGHLIHIVLFDGGGKEWTMSVASAGSLSRGSDGAFILDTTR